MSWHGHVGLPVESVHWSLLMMVTDNRSKKINSEVCRAMFFRHIQWNATKLIELCLTAQLDNDPKNTEIET